MKGPPDRANGSSLTVRAWGAGPSVLFLHGLGGSSRYWGRLAGLGGTYRGVAPDLAGFGRSPKPHGASYDVAYHLDQLEPLVAEPAILVGHSAGAILAAALAARRPGPVRALLLLGLPAFPDAGAATTELSALGRLARSTIRGGAEARIACTLHRVAHPVARVLVTRFHPELPAAVVADGLEHTWASYSRTLRSVVIEHRVAPDLITAAVPTVLLGGRQDPEAPAVYLEALDAKLRSASVPVRLELGAGDHHLALRHPEVVLRALEGLLGRYQVR